MKSKLFAFAILFLFLAHPASSSVDDTDLEEFKDQNCVTCHVDMDDENLTPPVTGWMKSVHRQVGVNCVDCHGGDPTDEDNAMEPSAGFTGKPNPEEIPGLCAKCHSNAKLMRAYNQQADQFMLYSGSVHGRKLLSGDEQAPSCVSCHGAHKILKVKDPESSVSRRAIPGTCGKCHARQEVFKKRKMPWNQLDQYKKSRHYELFKKGDLLVPSCVDCHGSHSILPSTSERTQTVCFNCHLQQAEFYKTSPHWRAYKKDGEPVCVHCHSNHGIMKPTVDNFTGDEDIDCIGCHDKSSEAYEAAGKLKLSTSSATIAFKRAKTLLRDFKAGAHGGFETSGLDEKISRVKDKLKELHTLTHKLNVTEVKEEAENIVKSAKEISEVVNDMLSELKIRWLGLLVGWIVFLGFAGVLWVKSKSMERRD